MKFNIKQFVEIERIKHDIRSNAEVARRCGWFPTSLSRRLRNPDMLKLADVERIANAMDCDMEIQFVDKDKK